MKYHNFLRGLSKPYPFKLFKGCVLQILLGHFVPNMGNMLDGQTVFPCPLRTTFQNRRNLLKDILL